MTKLIFLILKFFLNELFSLNSILMNFKNFIQEIDITKFLLYRFNKKKLFFRDDYLNSFLHMNYDRLNQKNRFSSKKIILVDLTLSHHVEYSLLNCLIANDLGGQLKKNLCGLINPNDQKTIQIAKSFGIKKFIYYKRKNIFSRFRYFLKATNLLNNQSNIKKIISLSYKNIEVGKSSYEQYIRFHTRSNFKIDFYFYLSLAKSLEAVDFFENLYESYEINHSIIAETQFIPHKIFFQIALKRKNIVYARFGSGLENYNVRIYKNFRDSFSHKRKYSKKLVSFLINNFKKKLIKEVNNYFSKVKPERRIGFEDAFVGNKRIVNIINIKHKNDLNKRFNFNKKNKLNILILPNVLQDNILNSEWSLFQSPYDWFKKTLIHIKDIVNFNWIIKPHPAEIFYREDLKAKEIFNSTINEVENIKFMDEKMHINNLHKHIDLVLTYNGSCGYEYSALGVPVVTAADTRYSDFEFTIAPKNIKKYLYTLKNIDKVINNFTVDRFKAKLFWYMDNCFFGVMRMSHGLIPRMATQGPQKYVNWNKFWQKLLINFKKKKNLNTFSKNFSLQQQNYNRHSFNLGCFGIKNIKKIKKLSDT